MLLSFWLPLAVMLIVALLFIFVPFIRYKQDESKLEVSSDWYRSREQELKQEFVAGMFSQDEYQQALTELKLTAKDELTLANQSSRKMSLLIAPKTGNKLIYIAAFTLLILVAGFYGANGLYDKQMDKQHILATMPELSQKVIQGSAQQVTAQELVNFSLGLRTKLAQKEDYIGWMLLGRVHLSLNDLNSGIDAFRKSYELNPSNVSNTISFAQALQYRGEPWDISESMTMLREVMRLQPDNVQAVILFGEGSILLEQNENAKRSFEIALSMLPSNDSRVGFINQRLQLLSNNSVSDGGLTISVQLDPSIDIDLSQFSHMFVFARTNNIPMPIAVKKLKVSQLPQLPITLTLSDDDIMLPEQKLSQFEQVNLYARLSLDENAQFSAGEWQGKVMNVSTKAEHLIEIQINESE